MQSKIGLGNKRNESSQSIRRHTVAIENISDLLFSVNAVMLIRQHQNGRLLLTNNVESKRHSLIILTTL